MYIAFCGLSGGQKNGRSVAIMEDCVALRQISCRDNSRELIISNYALHASALGAACLIKLNCFKPTQLIAQEHFE